MTSDRIQELSELVDEEPEDAMLRLMLGEEYLAAGDAGAALPHLEQAVVIDPRYSAAYRELGVVRAKLARPDEAAAVWERGIAVADETGDLQAGKEMQVLVARLRASPSRP